MPELARADYDRLVDDIVAALAPAAAAPAPIALAAHLEATLLRPDATAAEIERLCSDAVSWGVAGVCVNPQWIGLAAASLRGTPVLAIAAVGFPLGAEGAALKLAAAAECLKLGADELDVVMNLGALRAGQPIAAQAELAAIVALAHAAGARVKAIVELPLLGPELGQSAALAALAAGADFLKTATGFSSPRPATPEDVATLRALAAGRARIKAAGGIRTNAQALALLAAGADRLGASSVADLLG
ncbi:MAG TPA: deoxyribose-phosphate aldolase [Terriglobales bacterium]|nr:deoxyribose-phosphate aldolase [Terriglobales bacterium]